jgi:hypothetical protein
MDRRGGRYERTKLRLNITTIWTNVLALLLISIVGAAQLGFEIWRSKATEKSSISTSALEELLRTKLLDPETQQHQHKELLDAVRNSAPLALAVDGALQAELSELKSRVDNLEDADSRPTPRSFASLQVLAIFGWLAIIWAGFRGLVLLFQSIFVDGSIRKSAQALALISGSVIGAATLRTEFSFAKSIEALIKFDFKPKSSPSTSRSRPVDLHLHLDIRHGKTGNSPPNAMDCGEGNAQRVEPFNEGKETLEAGGQEKLRSIATALAKRILSDELIAITLVGSADKRALKPKTAVRFSSNAGLAQARIKTVRDELELVFGRDRIPILAMYSGPAKTGARLSIDDLASDRAVQVCAFWRPKS